MEVNFGNFLMHIEILVRFLLCMLYLYTRGAYNTKPYFYFLLEGPSF